tara:strand:- start:688 stop:1401 length:714 start_codon:yes stop_codon:yes gene_type:complete
LKTTKSISQFEKLIDGYLDKGYAIYDECFSKSFIDELRELAINRYENNDFRLAGIGDRFNFTKEKSIRSDQIYWLPKTGIEGVQQDYMNWVAEFVEYLNYSCFAGILDYNFHYAIYEEGSFYERHSDQFHNRDQRKFSMVLYLSEDWKNGDGGELVIYSKRLNSEQEAESKSEIRNQKSEMGVIDGNERTRTSNSNSIIIEPLPGRLVFFDSALEHEVLTSNALRVSLTGWMKRRGL